MKKLSIFFLKKARNYSIGQEINRDKIENRPNGNKPARYKKSKNLPSLETIENRTRGPGLFAFVKKTHYFYSWFTAVSFGLTGSGILGIGPKEDRVAS